jgi:hypothetical protein
VFGGEGHLTVKGVNKKFEPSVSSSEIKESSKKIKKPVKLTDAERKAKADKIRKKMEESGLLKRIADMRSGKKTKV